MRIAVAQVRVAIEDPDGNLTAVRDFVVEAAEKGADAVVLPELVTSGYVFADAAEAHAVAETSAGPTVTLLRELSSAYGLMIIAGWCQESGSPRPYNSVALVDRGELLGIYRKTHLWDREKLIFAPGDERPPVLPTRLGAIGLLVCYDLEFPELVRDLALRGAQLVCVPANWPANPVPDGERPVEVTKALAAAATNRVVIAVADRCGPERGVSWHGASVICAAEGYPVAGPARSEQSVLLYADVDVAATSDKRLGAFNDALADRRPELYP